MLGAGAGKGQHIRGVLLFVGLCPGQMLMSDVKCQRLIFCSWFFFVSLVFFCSLCCCGCGGGGGGTTIAGQVATKIGF